MQIYGIGIDIVELSRIEKVYQRFGKKFAAKILSAKEYLAWTESTKPLSFLAKRFAAKEALVKALGTGFVPGIYLRDISISHQDSGQPFFVLSNGIEQFCQQKNISQMFLSVSDEKKYCVAQALLTT